MGWHTQLNEDEEPYLEEFNKFYDTITIEREMYDGDYCLTIRGNSGVQVEIHRDDDQTFFRCGHITKAAGKGGTAFNFSAVARCLMKFNLLDEGT